MRAVKSVPRNLSQEATLSQELLAFLKLKQVGFSILQAWLVEVLRYQFDHLFVKFHGWYEDVDNTFIVMEYVEHGDLSQYVQRSRQGASALRSLMEVKEITRQILEGLEVLHSKRIYHRDLKPQVCSMTPLYLNPLTESFTTSEYPNSLFRSGLGQDSRFWCIETGKKYLYTNRSRYSWLSCSRDSWI